jgi:hypothetical protein
MPNLFASAVLAACALFFLFTAVVSGLTPGRFAASLGLSIADPGGEVEIRAQYAGFFLAAALVCAAGLVGWAPPASALFVAATIFGGLIGGRLVGFLANGGANGLGPTIRALYVIDALGFGLTVWSLVLVVRA